VRPVASGGEAANRIGAWFPCIFRYGGGLRTSPTPSVRTEPIIRAAPTYARAMSAFGSVASGRSTDRKNAAGMRMAASGTPSRRARFAGRSEAARGVPAGEKLPGAGSGPLGRAAPHRRDAIPVPEQAGVLGVLRARDRAAELVGLGAGREWGVDQGTGPADPRLEPAVQTTR
jgi:hypothetical protein